MCARLLVLTIHIFLSLNSFSQSIHDISVKDRSGNSQLMSALLDRNTLIFVLPADSGHQSLLDLKHFMDRYRDTVNVIAIPSIEFGGGGHLEHVLSALSGYPVTVLDSMRVQKGASGQSELFRWLTHKELNLHYDDDVSGAGHKFFVSKSGVLFAMMPAAFSLRAPIVDKIVHSNIPVR